MIQLSSGATFNFELLTLSSTGGVVAPDSAPLVYAVIHNNALDSTLAAAITVSAPLKTGAYLLSGTVPAGYALGDTGKIVASYLVSGVTYIRTVGEFQVVGTQIVSATCLSGLVYEFEDTALDLHTPLNPTPVDISGIESDIALCWAVTGYDPPSGATFQSLAENNSSGAAVTGIDSQPVNAVKHGDKLLLTFDTPSGGYPSGITRVAVKIMVGGAAKKYTSAILVQGSSA